MASAGLTLDTFPAIGRMVTATLWGGRPNAKAAIGFDATAVPDGVIRLAGGWAHVAPALVLLRNTDGTGGLQIPLGVPQSPTLVGVKLHAQTAIEDISASYGLTLTRGLTMQVGQ